MNAGFSNLEILKKRLLASTMVSTTQFDSVIQAIGLGMAGAISQFCQRPFAYAQTQEVFGADRIEFILSLTPLATFISAEFKETEADGWVLQDSTFIQTIDYANGIILLPPDIDPGEYYSQVRITYTGGYWWDTAEPTDPVHPTPQPAGSTLLPDEVRLAWLMQCEQMWDKRDQLGLSITDKPGQQVDLDEIKLIPLVKQILTNYVKINLT